MAPLSGILFSLSAGEYQLTTNTVLPAGLLVAHLSLRSERYGPASHPLCITHRHVRIHHIRSPTGAGHAKPGHIHTHMYMYMLLPIQHWIGTWRHALCFSCMLIQGELPTHRPGQKCLKEDRRQVFRVARYQHERGCCRGLYEGHHYLFPALDNEIGAVGPV